MKTGILSTLILLFLSTIAYGQELSQSELQELKSNKMGALEDHLAMVKVIEEELTIIESQLSVISGWRKGISGTIGFDFDKSSAWISNPNPNSRATGLSLGVTGFLKNDNEKTFMHNNLSLQKSWNSLDLDTTDDTGTEGIFSSGTVDVLNISSLAGYKLTETLSVSALAELYSSLDRITEQGVIDFGVGLTWLPYSNFSVTLNPLNYHFVYTNNTGLESTGALGARLRADYLLKFKLLANDCTWQTSLTGFFPYNDSKMNVMNDIDNPDLVVYESSLREITWLNNLSLELWKGIGLGFGWGLRRSDFEALNAQAPKLQSFFNFGLSFTY